jgi:hypothetical protein
VSILPALGGAKNSKEKDDPSFDEMREVTDEPPLTISTGKEKSEITPRDSWLDDLGNREHTTFWEARIIPDVPEQFNIEVKSGYPTTKIRRAPCARLSPKTFDDIS